MKTRYIIASCILSFCILSSCQKCKECYSIEGEGTVDEQTIDLGEKCGDELEELDNMDFEGTDGGVQTYCD